MKTFKIQPHFTLPFALLSDRMSLCNSGAFLEMKNSSIIKKDVTKWESLYYATSDGKVFSKHGLIPKEISAYKTKWYKSIRLCNGKERRVTRVHIIIAETFIPNPENKRCVNHKNGIKWDNRVENLEWCTHSENTIHSLNIGTFGDRSGISSPRCQIFINVMTGVYYCGLTELSRVTGINRNTIKNYIRMKNFDKIKNIAIT